MAKSETYIVENNYEDHSDDNDMDSDDNEESGLDEIDQDLIVQDDKSGGKKRLLSIILKLALISAVVFVIFYLIYFSTKYGKAKFVLANSEVTREMLDSDEEETKFRQNEKMYFHIEKEKSNLKSNLLILKIEFFKEKVYTHYKQISYEIDKDFPSFSTYLPGVYFSRQGKYRIKALLDGKIVSTKEILVTE